MYESLVPENDTTLKIAAFTQISLVQQLIEMFLDSFMWPAVEAVHLFESVKVKTLIICSRTTQFYVRIKQVFRCL